MARRIAKGRWNRTCDHGNEPADCHPSPLTLRRCFWLCLPALVIGAVLRISLLVAVPEVFYGSDSNSYFVTAHSIYIDHSFEMPAKRRYIYPLLLVAAPPVPFCNTAQVVAFVQHAAGLVIDFRHRLGHRALGAPAAALGPGGDDLRRDLATDALLRA